MRIPAPPASAITVRECQQRTIEGPEIWRWDFAWRDPASGRVTQYCVQSYLADGAPDAHLREARKIAKIKIIREIQHKCGLREALQNQYSLSLPRGMRARYI